MLNYVIRQPLLDNLNSSFVIYNDILFYVYLSDAD